MRTNIFFFKVLSNFLAGPVLPVIYILHLCAYPDRLILAGIFSESFQGFILFSFLSSLERIPIQMCPSVKFEFETLTMEFKLYRTLREKIL